MIMKTTVVRRREKIRHFRSEADYESVLELLIHLLVVNLEIDSVKAGKLLTSKFNLLTKLIQNGIDKSASKVHNFFHAIEESSYDLTRSIISEQRSLWV